MLMGACILVDKVIEILINEFNKQIKICQKIFQIK
jgi:hypothetical protein